MVRTYDAATIVYRNGEKVETNLEEFFSMCGSEGVLERCPPGPYTYKHETNGIFEVYCTICLEKGCTDGKFQRLSQKDPHKQKFYPNLSTAHWKHLYHTS